MLPLNTPIGRLRIAEVLDAFDGPRLFVARSATGTAHLALWLDETQSGDVWLYVSMSEARREEILFGKIPLRDAYLEPEEGFVYRIIVPRESAAAEWSTVPPTEIDEEDLPPEDDYIDIRGSAGIETMQHHDGPARPNSKKRQIERLFVDKSTKSHDIGQDVVATVFSAWFSCREASLRAQGLRSYFGAPPAIAARVGSFSVDLSVPIGEVYVRSVLAWVDFVAHVGVGEIHSRLARNGIDSVTCESLLHTIVRNGLRFSVSLLDSVTGSPTVAFEIDESLAKRLLHELRDVVPVLGSDKIPQADNLQRVIDIVLQLRDRGEFDTEHADLVPRQVDYYKHAARLLGFITPSDMLTVVGKRLASATAEEAQLAILRNQFETSDCGWTWTKWAHVDSLSSVHPQTALDFLRTAVPSLSFSTAKRRALTLRAWHVRLFEPDA